METTEIPSGTDMSDGKRRAFIKPDDVRRIIRSPVYRGIVRVRHSPGRDADHTATDPEWDEFKGAHQPIVDEATWFRANRALPRVENSARVRRVREPKGKCVGLLQGFIVCEDCDAAMSPGLTTRIAKNGEPHRYYRCNQLVKGGELSGCTTRQVSCDAAESAVVSLIRSIAENPALFARVGFNASDKKREKEIADLNAELLNLETSSAEQRQGIDKFLACIRDGKNKELTVELAEAAEKAKSQIAQYEARRIQVEARLHRLMAKVPSLVELGAAFATVTQALSIAEFQVKRELFQQLIRCVKIRKIRISPTAGNAPESKRTYRMVLEIRTDAVLGFGKVSVDGLLAARGYSDIELKVTFQIVSNAKLQLVTLMEHGYSCVSRKYEEEAEVPTAQKEENPIQRALRWRKAIDAGMKYAEISVQENVSHGLISQHMSLLKLPQVIVDFLAAGRDRALVRKFSTRELLRLASLAPEEALKAFHARIAGIPLQGTFSL